MLTCIPMKESAQKDLYQLKERQGPCQIAFLLLLLLLLLAVLLLPGSHSHYSSPSQASLHPAGL